MVVHDLPLAMRVWTILRAVNWRWTITEVLAQPEALLDDVMTLEFALGRIEAQKLNG